MTMIYTLLFLYLKFTYALNNHWKSRNLANTIIIYHFTFALDMMWRTSGNAFLEHLEVANFKNFPRSHPTMVGF